MKSIDKITTMVGKHEFIQPVASLFTRAFANDPLERSVILATEPLPPGGRDGIITEDHWMKHWVHHVTAKIEGGGEIISAGDGAAVALWFPPGIKKSEFDRNASPFVLLDFADRFEGIKESVLGGKRFWYLNLVARDPERNEKGAVRAVIEPYLEKAKQEGIPVWLEATTTHARDVYIHFGFRTVAEVVVGKGSITENGDYVVGGEGFVVYGMIAEPGKTGGII